MDETCIAHIVVYVSCISVSPRFRGVSACVKQGAEKQRDTQWNMSLFNICPLSRVNMVLLFYLQATEHRSLHRDSQQVPQIHFVPLPAGTKGQKSHVTPDDAVWGTSGEGFVDIAPPGIICYDADILCICVPSHNCRDESVFPPLKARRPTKMFDPIGQMK